MPEIVINGRFRGQRVTGIQRVAREITARLRTPHTVIEPAACGHGAPGHLWEQVVLPSKAGTRLIWGPCNTGPVLASGLIVTIHGAGVFDHPEWFSPWFVRFHNTLWPLLARRARRIVTVSHFSRERISAALGVPLSRIDVVSNGVDESFRPAGHADVESASAACGVQGRPYFATLSTIEPRKNLKLVLRAWARARSRLPADAVLLVVGGQGPKAVFGHQASGRVSLPDGVHFTGYLPEQILPPLLTGALGVLYPSIYEGFGLPVLEAMACGAPIVTTRRTSLPEVGGDAALYVDPEDPDDLASVLAALASSETLRSERRALGLARAKLFSWATAAQSMDRLFARYA